MSQMRIAEFHSELVTCLDRITEKAIRKTYWAERTPQKASSFCVASRDRSRLCERTPNLLLPNPYDTKENRFVRELLLSLQSHLDDLASGEDGMAFEESFSLVCSANKKLLSSPYCQGFSEKTADNCLVDVRLLPEEYREFYHAYVVLKYALCEWEADQNNGLSLVNWEERDVLVGSFGSEAQWKHNLAKKYYYAPERYFDPTCFPIRYVALYQSSHFSEAGIRYYGEVKDIRRVQRKKIRFAVRHNNGEEGYYVFRVKSWKSLANPIAIKDEGVFAPKFTNLFLLLRAKESYELFHVRTERQYRVLQQLRRILGHASAEVDWKELYPIEGGKTIRVHFGIFELLDENNQPMMSVRILDFLQHPTAYIDDVFQYIEREPKSPQQTYSEPMWLKREREEYEERYGKPYSDD